MTITPQQLGVYGLYLFAATLWSNRVLAVLGCLLMVAALWRERSTAWPLLRRSPLTWLSLGLGAYAMLRAVIVAVADPALLEQHAIGAWRIIYFSGFIPVAWYLGADSRRFFNACALTTAGFTVARMWHFDWTFSYPQPWWQMRLGLGLEFIPFGYYAATILLGLLIFAPRMYRALAARGTGGTLLAAAAAGWLLLVGLALQGVLLSQARSVWLCLLPLLAVVFVLGLRSLWRRLRWRGALLAVVPLALAVALLQGNVATLEKRLTAEQHTLQDLLAADFDSIRSGDERGRNYSVGTRVRMLQTGMAHWLQAPFFGHGPAASQLLLAASDDVVLSRYNDYHNALVDMLVRHGMVGLLLLLLCIKYTLASGWQAWRQGRIAPDMALFLACALTLMLLSTLTNFRMLNFDWRYWMFMIAGALASYHYHPATAAGGTIAAARA